MADSSTVSVAEKPRISVVIVALFKLRSVVLLLLAALGGAFLASAGRPGKDTLSTPFKYNIGEHEKWAGKTYDDLNKDSIASSREALEQNLSNRGIQYGTKAYDDAMRDWEYGTQKARSDFMLGAYNTGMSTALTERNQPLMEGQALMGAGQIQQPQWVSGPQAGVAGTDISGIQNAAYQGSVARAQANAAQQGAMFKSLGSLGGMALGGWLSDERAKEVGPPVGTDPESGLLIVTACAPGIGAAPAATSIPATTVPANTTIPSPMPTASPSGPTSWSLVVVGDSIPFNSPEDCPGCTGFVDRYAKDITVATGHPVKVQNLPSTLASRPTACSKS